MKAVRWGGGEGQERGGVMSEPLLGCLSWGVEEIRSGLEGES